jgi:hypothetical protein
MSEDGRAATVDSICSDGVLTVEGLTGGRDLPRHHTTEKTEVVILAPGIRRVDDAFYTKSFGVQSPSPSSVPKVWPLLLVFHFVATVSSPSKA